MLIPHKAGGGTLARGEPHVFAPSVWPHTRDMKSANCKLSAKSKKVLRALVALSYDLRPQRRCLPVASRIVPVWVYVGAYNGADGELSTFFRRFLPAVLVVNR